MRASQHDADVERHQRGLDPASHSRAWIRLSYQRMRGAVRGASCVLRLRVMGGTSAARQVDERRNPRTRANGNQLIDRWLEVIDIEASTKQGYERRSASTSGRCSGPCRSVSSTRRSWSRSTPSYGSAATTAEAGSTSNTARPLSMCATSTTGRHAAHRIRQSAGRARECAGSTSAGAWRIQACGRSTGSLAAR